MRKFLAIVVVVALAAAMMIPASAASTDDAAVYIGVNAWDPAANAAYDNLSIYNRALSADEVAALNAAGGDPTSAADGLVGFYKFEGNLNNEVEGGVAGEAVGFKFAAPAGDPVFEDGTFKTTNGVNDGAKFDVKLGKSFTVSIKVVSVEAYVFASPIVWIGGTNQPGGDENWVGIWHDFADNGVAAGSNDAPGSRVGVAGAQAGGIAGTENLFVTLVVDNGTMTLYYNGEEVGKTADGAAAPDPFGNADNAADDNTGDDNANTGDDNTNTGDDTNTDDGEKAPATGFATIALAIAAIGSGAYIVSKKH